MRLRSVRVKSVIIIPLGFPLFYNTRRFQIYHASSHVMKLCRLSFTEGHSAATMEKRAESRGTKSAAFIALLTTCTAPCVLQTQERNTTGARFKSLF